MKHLSECQYAVVRKSDGYVLNIIVSEHNPELIALINDTYEEDTEMISCCEHGLAFVGGNWDGENFRPIQPYPSWSWSSTAKEWQAPTGMPDDQRWWTWDEENLEWKEAPLND